MLSNSIQCSLNDHFVPNISPDFLGIQDESTLFLEKKKMNEIWPSFKSNTKSNISQPGYLFLR